jgi:hypothetical protein
MPVDDVCSVRDPLCAERELVILPDTTNICSFAEVIRDLHALPASRELRFEVLACAGNLEAVLRFTHNKFSNELIDALCPLSTSVNWQSVTVGEAVARLAAAEEALSADDFAAFEERLRFALMHADELGPRRRDTSKLLLDGTVAPLPPVILWREEETDISALLTQLSELTPARTLAQKAFESPSQFERILRFLKNDSFDDGIDELCPLLQNAPFVAVSFAQLEQEMQAVAVD